MNVYAGPEGRRCLVGRARVPWDHGPILVAGETREQFAIHAIRCPGERGGLVEIAVLLSPGQRPDLLPGWRPAIPAGLAGHLLRLMRQTTL